GRVTPKLPCPNVTEPEPLHSGQVMTLAPGAAPFPPHVLQLSVRGTVIGSFPPLAASSKGISTAYSIEGPRCGPCERVRRFPASKIELNRSPNPPSPPKSSKEKLLLPPGPVLVKPPAPGRAPPIAEKAP